MRVDATTAQPSSATPSGFGMPSASNAGGGVPTLMPGYTATGTPATNPDGTMALSASTVDLSGLGMSSNEQYDQVIVNKQNITVADAMADFLNAEGSDPQNLLLVQNELHQAGYLDETPTGTLDHATEVAYLGLLRDSSRQHLDTATVVAQQISHYAAQGGYDKVKEAAAPRTLGLGKFDINLTNPADVAAVTNTIAQSLIGRDATPDEIKAITTSLHGEERAAGEREFAQYTSQQEAYFESIHGGVANKTAAQKLGEAGAGQNAAKPETLQQKLAGQVIGASVGPTSGSPASEQLAPQPGGPNLAPTPGSPASLQMTPQAMPSQVAAANYRLGQQQAAQASMASPGGISPTTPPNLPPGAIQLSDGTILVPPTQIENQQAPNAQALAEQYYRATPAYTAFGAVQAYKALQDLVARGGGAAGQ